MFSWGTYLLVLLTILIWNGILRWYMMDKIRGLYRCLNEEYIARKALEREVDILNAKISCLVPHHTNGEK